MDDNVNGKQVVAGLLSIVLIGMVASTDINAFLKLIIIAILFIAGAAITGAFR